MSNEIVSIQDNDGMTLRQVGMDGVTRIETYEGEPPERVEMVGVYAGEIVLERRPAVDLKIMRRLDVPEPTLLELVKAAMENARENGYDFYNEDVSSLDVAADMASFDFDLEGYALHLIAECVNQVREGA